MDAALAALSANEIPMTTELWRMLAWGIGIAFVLSLIMLVILLVKSGIDHGFLGLIFLLILVVFLVAFSLLVAAATPGWSIKVAVTVFNGILAFGTRLISDRFLNYLESE
jgi:hypothetical protein